MNITISLSPALVFDMLSVLEVKRNKFAASNEVQKYNIVYSNYVEMVRGIHRALGSEKAIEILESQEYFNLFKANQLVFETVDLTENNPETKVSAYEIAQLNLLRYKYKQELQKKFFETNISEVKTGKYVE